MPDPDVVVVGSGPTGAMAAATLVEGGADVMMLDAGHHVPGGLVVHVAGNTVFRRMAWADCATDRLDPRSDPGVDWYSSLSLGGLSNFWTAAVPRFAPDDFLEGARLDERYRWPVTYEDLEPYYVAAERRLGVTRAARSFGSRRTNGVTSTACRRTGRRSPTRANGRATASARCRSRRGARGWSPGVARSSTATTAWSRHWRRRARSA